MASFVIGSDGEFFSRLSSEEQEQFFSDCTWYFANRYGEENIISAVVHRDETTPHLHLNIFPEHNGKICAKQLFNPKELKELQTDFHDKVGKKYGLQRGKEGSQKAHLSTAEYKASTIIKNAVIEATEITTKANTELRNINAAVQKPKSILMKQLSKLRAPKLKEIRL